MYDCDMELLKDYAFERGLKPRTIYGYKDSLQKYTNYTNRSFCDSLKLYETEEENKIRWKYSTLKKELLSWRQTLYQTYLKNTAKIHFQKICAMIKYYDIVIHDLPRVNNRNVKDNAPLTYDDLLTHEEIGLILSKCNPLFRALISFMISTGCARKEALSLRVSDYIEANSTEINDDDLKIILNQIDVDKVPTFRCKRFKTNKHYYTFCTPQANRNIKEYLLTRKNLKNDDKLFKVNHDLMNTTFREINKELNLGFVNGRKRCRSHMFRKYHASTLYNNGMNMVDVDSLQGRGKDSTHSSYFMEDPELLKQKYIKYLEVLTI